MTLLKSKEKTDRLQELYLNGLKPSIEVLPYPVYVTDLELNIVLANNRFMELFNLDKIHNLKSYQLFKPSSTTTKICPLMKVFENGKPEQTKLYDQSLGMTLLINAGPLFHNENMTGGIVSILDLTEEQKKDNANYDLIEVYANTVTELKALASNAQRGRDAFLNMLEDLNESYNELEDLFLKLIRVLVNALDAKSPWTKGHSERVSIYAEQIAIEMSLDADEVKRIKLAGILHDIGKIGTSDYLLDKPGKLTNEEFEMIKKHPSQGAEILADIKQLKHVVPAIKYHHEKIDGRGYPDKLPGEEIPLEAKILHVADSFDSMTSDRPYRPSPGIDFALSELNKFRGIQFDNEVVDAFIKVIKKSKKDFSSYFKKDL